MLVFSERYLQDVLAEDNSGEQRQSDSQVEDLLQQLLKERRDLLTYLTYYQVPDYVIVGVVRRLFRFILDRAAYVSGNIDERANKLTQGYFYADPWAIQLLFYSYQVPYGVIMHFVRSIVYFALGHIVTILEAAEGQGSK